jgi:dTDP-4-dehydrorhamnose 3,5-epimerase
MKSEVENKSAIEGVIIRELSTHGDQRGWLIELFRQDQLETRQQPVMSYISMTKPGIARGPHEHREQTDIICFVGPSRFKLQMWDNRPESATYGRQFSLEAGEFKPLAVIIPPGIVHAYKNIGDQDGLVINAPNRLYAGPGKTGQVDEIRYENKPDSKFKPDF